MCISVPITIKNEFFFTNARLKFESNAISTNSLFKFLPKLHICVSRPKP